MARLSNLFFKYLMKEFFAKFFLFFLILIGIVYLADIIELIRRVDEGDAVGIGSILKLALYKLPDVGQQILPFITLFATIACLRNLSDRQELVCIRGAGLSAWQFLVPLITSVFFISLLYITILHPLAAASMARYEALQNLYFGDGIETVSIIDGGLWLRQEDANGNFIMNAESLDAGTWVLDNVTLFLFDNDNTHIQRIDAAQAELRPNEWIFKDARLYNAAGAEPSILPTLSYTTSLTTETLIDSFSNPQTLSFWRLPSFINALNETGLDTTNIKIYYQTLLSLPLTLIAMVLVGAALTLRTMRVSGLTPIIAGALLSGIIIFFLSGFLSALGQGDEIPPAMAVWATPILVILSAVTFLTHLEDG
jgi:lipopolysaccharide export system permease protein